MADVTRFEIGSAVQCSDGLCGRLTSVVIDPIAGAVTHLVVEPEHRWGLGRLVPVDLVAAANAEVDLRCTLAEFDRLDGAEETQFLTGTGAEWGYDGQVLSWPYYGLGLGRIGGLDDYGGNAPQPIVYDKLPIGEVAVRRGDEVHAADGRIGRVQGLLIDPRDNHVSHVLLQEGHLWGRREVAIPITDVASVDDGVRLKTTKDEVLRLPPVEFDHGPHR
jgi:sporulation protein YlmC with PRC-barrel domain